MNYYSSWIVFFVHWSEKLICDSSSSVGETTQDPTAKADDQPHSQCCHEVQKEKYLTQLNVNNMG